MKDLMKMMKQAQELQGRMQRMQEELAALEVSGQSGAGLVKVTLNGKGEMRSVKIDSSLLKPDDAEIVEDRGHAPCRKLRSHSGAGRIGGGT